MISNTGISLVACSQGSFILFILTHRNLTLYHLTSLLLFVRHLCAGLIGRYTLAVVIPLFVGSFVPNQ